MDELPAPCRRRLGEKRTRRREGRAAQLHRLWIPVAGMVVGGIARLILHHAAFPRAAFPNRYSRSLWGTERHRAAARHPATAGGSAQCGVEGGVCSRGRMVRCVIPRSQVEEEPRGHLPGEAGLYRKSVRCGTKRGHVRQRDRVEEALREGPGRGCLYGG